MKDLLIGVRGSEREVRTFDFSFVFLVFEVNDCSSSPASSWACLCFRLRLLWAFASAFFSTGFSVRVSPRGSCLRFALPRALFALYEFILDSGILFFSQKKIKNLLFSLSYSSFLLILSS